MKWIFVVAAACLVATVSAVPVKDSKANETLPLGKNETLPAHNLTEPAHHRVRRECSSDDMVKLQAAVTSALEKEMLKLLSGKAQNRSRRAVTSAAAGTVATPDGKVKSNAVTKGDSAGVVAESGPDSLQGGSHLPPSQGLPDDAHRNGSIPILEGAPVEGQNGEHPPVAPAPGQELPVGSGPGQHPSEGPAGQPSLPSAGQPTLAAGAAESVAPGLTLQKVKASANKENGTAVASAVAKRAVHQDIASEADKAISKAESTKGGDSHNQKVGATGTNLGIATANIAGKNNVTRDGQNQDNTLQTVNASGKKAVATASKSTDGGNTVQGAQADGGELSIASVSTGSEQPPAPQGIPKIMKRSVCLPTEMNDDMRLLIRTTIENAFANAKKEMHA